MQIKLLLVTFIALGSIELLSADAVKKVGPVSKRIKLNSVKIVSDSCQIAHIISMYELK